MARPLKKGIDYFPIECAIDEDDKFVDIIEEVGVDVAMGRILLLLGMIYKTNGYYIKWDNKTEKKFCRVKGIKREDMKNTISILTGNNLNQVEYNQDPTFFNRSMFIDEQVLTSKSIQRQFFFSTGRRKGKKLDRKYLLLEYGDGDYVSKKAYGDKPAVTEKGIHTIIDDVAYPFGFLSNGELTDNTKSDESHTDNDNINEDNVDIKLVNDDINEDNVDNNINVNNNPDNVDNKYTYNTTLKNTKLNNTILNNNKELPNENKCKHNSKEKLSKLINYWNDVVTEQPILKEIFNMNLSHEVVDILDKIDIDDIKKSITNYGNAYSFNDMPISCFENFMTSKNIQKWFPESSVENTKKRYSGNKRKPIIKNVSDEDLKRIEKEAEAIEW